MRHSPIMRLRQKGEKSATFSIWEIFWHPRLDPAKGVVYPRHTSHLLGNEPLLLMYVLRTSCDRCLGAVVARRHIPRTFLLPAFRNRMPSARMARLILSRMVRRRQCFHSASPKDAARCYSPGSSHPGSSRSATLP